MFNATENKTDERGKGGRPGEGNEVKKMKEKIKRKETYKKGGRRKHGKK